MHRVADEGSSSIRYKVEPRLIPPIKAARFFHMTLLEFSRKLPALRKEGFPSPCPVTGHFDLKAMNLWQDRRSGLNGDAPTMADHHAIMWQRLAEL